MRLGRIRHICPREESWFRSVPDCRCGRDRLQSPRPVFPQSKGRAEKARIGSVVSTWLTLEVNDWWSDFPEKCEGLDFVNPGPRPTHFVSREQKQALFIAKFPACQGNGCANPAGAFQWNGGSAEGFPVLILPRAHGERENHQLGAADQSMASFPTRSRSSK